MEQLTDNQLRKKANLEKAIDFALPYFASKVPPLGNLTAPRITDEVGVIKEAIKDLEKVSGTMMERLKSMTRDQKTSRGDNFNMEKRESERTALNQAAAKEFFTELSDMGISPSKLLAYLRANANSSMDIYTGADEPNALQSVMTTSEVVAYYVQRN